MTTQAGKIAKKKTSNRSLFYRISAWLHLWLGLVSGIIVIIVCLTGCIWVFNEEITGMLEPSSGVPFQQGKAVIMPSQIMETAAKDYPGKRVSYAIYRKGKAIEATVGERAGGAALRINPYTGSLISKVDRKPGEVGFFRWILNGHRFLWMPFKIGRPIVNYATLVCVITLISGLVLWWPKKWNRSTRERSFKIKWGASTKRINYDLHNVLGFYAMLFLLAIGITGMVYGLKWWSQSLYWVSSGGKTLPEYVELKSDSLQAHKHFTPQQAADLAFQKVAGQNAEADGFYMSFPDTAKQRATILVIAYPDKRRFYNLKRYTFDQHTLQELKGSELYDTEFKGAAFGTQLRRMNYDIHIGAVLGLPGKFMAFFASLIGATLPVTGFIVWLGKKKKKPAAKKTAKGGITNAQPVVG